MPTTITRIGAVTKVSTGTDVLYISRPVTAKVKDGNTIVIEMPDNFMRSDELFIPFSELADNLGTANAEAYLDEAMRIGLFILETPTIGQQPDGDLVNLKADGEFFRTEVPLAEGAEYTSAWFDTDGWGALEFFISSNVPSANKGIIIEFTENTQGDPVPLRSQDFYEFSTADVRVGYKDLRIRPKLDGFRFRYINGSEAQSTVYIAAVGRVSPETGRMNSANSLITTSLERDVALGNVSNYRQNSKFGRNPDVDSAQGADLWNGGRAGLGVFEYTGFNATANENLRTLSSNVNDVGTLVSSGTITTTAQNLVIDSGATFITDGVSVGDIVLNDDRGTYGYVTSVDSETQLSVFKMVDTSVGEYDNIATNAYRVATVGGTGAAVVAWKRVLNQDLERQGTVFVILNGTTPVISTVDAYRCSRGQVLLTGSGGGNAGEITLSQATTTANVFCVMPIGSNQTLICADTVPKDTIFLIEEIHTSVSVSGGTAASGVISLRVRERYGVFQTRRIYDLSTGGGSNTDSELGGIAIQEGTDFKLRVDSVSANNMRVSGKMEYLEIDEITTV